MIDYLNSCNKTKEIFFFLIRDHNFEIRSCDSQNYGFTIEYEKDEIRIYLSYDYRDNAFNFCFIRGRFTRVPNDNDIHNIIPFYGIFKRYDNNIEFNYFQPNDSEYETALKNNAFFLKKILDKNSSPLIGL